MKSLRPKFRTLNIAMLLVLAMSGCTNPAVSPGQESRSAYRSSPIRVIITLEPDHLPQAYDQQLFPLISDICACPPKFINKYRTNSIIYEISPPPDMSFSGFRNFLLDKGSAIGVHSVEQDSQPR
jgi:hypothetical protein